MCKALEDMKNEAEQRKAITIAIKMIESGILTFEQISQFTDLPLNTVKELAHA
jgi:predicted HTH domain antitoxin